jgi:hypothetical protein
VELAVRISAVDHVHAFGRPMVSLPCLRPDRLSSERDFIGLKRLPGAHQLHCSGFFVQDDVVGLGLGVYMHNDKKANYRRVDQRKNVPAKTSPS